MKPLKFIPFSIVLIFLLHPLCAIALDLGDLAGAAGTLKKGSQALQTGQALAGAGTGQTGVGLTGLLVKQLGISPTQASGGSGAIFQYAKSKMDSAAFNKLSQSVPGMQGILAAAPAAKSTGTIGALSSLAGNSGGNAGNLLGLVGSFQQLGLSPDMVQKFVPIVVQYVQGTGGGAVSSMLESALMGGM